MIESNFNLEFDRTDVVRGCPSRRPGGPHRRPPVAVCLVQRPGAAAVAVAVVLQAGHGPAVAAVVGQGDAVVGGEEAAAVAGDNLGLLAAALAEALGQVLKRKKIIRH